MLQGIPDPIAIGHVLTDIIIIPENGNEWFRSAFSEVHHSNRLARQFVPIPPEGPKFTIPDI